MGNQASTSQPSIRGSNQGLSTIGSSTTAAAEPLESFRKEQQRDEHLKNLGFKRSRSLRRSIAKKFRKNKDKNGKGGVDEDQTDRMSSRKSSPVPLDTAPPPPQPLPPPLSSTPTNTLTTTATKSGPKQEIIRETTYDTSNRRRIPQVGDIQPLPAQVQDAPRRMDKLRKSLRSSLRKRHHQHHKEKSGGGSGSSSSTTQSENSKPQAWQQDEVAVRSGTCNFQVKYLGCVEVFDSRGMQVCEEAIKVLKASKQKSVRSILYVHGDGLRVVDEDTKGLIVDQTIEKVSFCAPDRNYDRGFSYICRDGTTRRWMCHSFMAVKDSGERLSHAVGCAFAVCLERKQKRDKECNVSMSFDNSNSSFTRMGSFRQATITERLTDPQILKQPTVLPPPSAIEPNPHAIARPHATELMLQRQTSFRGFHQLGGNSPFKRQLSLRLSELPSTLERQKLTTSSLATSAHEDNHSNPSVHLLKSQLSQLYKQSESTDGWKVASIKEETNEENNDSINAMCQHLSHGLSLLSGAGGDYGCTTTTTTTSQQPQSLPFILSSTSPLPTVPENSAIESTCSGGTTTSSNKISPSPILLLQPTKLDPLANVKPVQYDNPWDFVPDQPNKQHSNSSNNNNNNASTTPNSNSHYGCDSSSGISSTASQSLPDDWSNPPVVFNGANVTNNDVPFLSQDEIWSSKSILDDPFDAEWAALATRNNSKNHDNVAMSPTNPFKQNSIQTAFELQM